MLTNNDRITVPQAVALLITTSLGIGVLSLPHDVAVIARSDGWILTIISGLLVLAISQITGTFVKKYPEETFVEVSQRVLGKIPGYLLTVILILYFTVETGYVAREFSAVMKAFMLPQTPTEFLVITLLLTTVYLIRHGIEPTARVGEILFPILIVPIVAMYVTVLPEADFTELLPIFITPPKKMALGAISAMLSFLGFEILLILGPYIRSPERVRWILYASIGTVILLYLFITVVVFIAIGVSDARLMTWPSMMVIRSIAAPGRFIERLDALALALWIIAAFTTINAAYLTASIAMAHLTKSREFKAYIAMLFPWMYLVAMYPENVLEVRRIGPYMGAGGLIVAVLFPSLVLLVDLLKGKGRSG